MLTEDIVGAVLLKVTGGEPSSESSVQAPDVKARIPDGINMMMGTRINEEYGLDPSVYPNGLFVNVYDNLPVQVNSRNLAYVRFPVRPLSVRQGKSVIAVGQQGGRQFTRILHDEGTLGSFLMKSKTDIISFDVEGDTAVIYNLPLNVSQIYAKIIVHIDSVGYTDEIFIPSGMENLLIDTIYGLVMDQRSNPKSRIIDGRDAQ